WSGCTLTNAAGGLFDLQTDDTYTGPINSGTSAIYNAGAFRRSAGTGTADLTVIVFRNTGGTIDVRSGTLDLYGDGGSGGTLMAGAGAVLELSGGTWDAGTVGYTIPSPPTGVVLWKGGTLQGSGGLTNQGYLTIAGNVALSQTTLTNAGTITHASGTLA